MAGFEVTPEVLPRTPYARGLRRDVGGLEPGDAEGAAVTFDAVAEGGERSVGIHAFAEIGKDLLAGLVAVQGFKLVHSVGWVSRVMARAVWGKIARSRSNLPGLTGAYPFWSRCASMTVSKAHSEWRGSAGIG